MMETHYLTDGDIFSKKSVISLIIYFIEKSFLIIYTYLINLKYRYIYIFEGYIRYLKRKPYDYVHIYSENINY